MNIIKSNEITKKYGRVVGLENFDISIKKNKIVGLVGRNGAGKTTFLKLLAGYLKPSSGHIKVLGQNPFNSLKVSSNMIFIDEKMIYPSNLTIFEILESASSFYGNWNMDLAKSLFNYFKLKQNYKYKNLSKGMKSIFNSIIGISTRCPITIMDEPTSGMDAVARKDFYRAILKDYISFPRTIIISSHHINEIEHIIEDIIIIKDGRLLLHLSMDELRELALGLKGKKTVIEKFISDKEVLFRQDLGKDNIFAVIANNPDHVIDLENINNEIEIQLVNAEETCVYLMNNEEWRIDDVFDEE